MPKRITLTEKRFAKRIMARAVAIAERKGMPSLCQQEVWKLLVEASWKPRKPSRKVSR